MESPLTRQHKKRLKNTAFSLIELLVVIAVLSVLIAVMLPALNMARSLGKRMVCQGRLRQVGQAWRMYLDDHEGKFYQRYNAETTYGGWRGTNLALQDTPRPLNPYLSLPPDCNSEESAKVFQCPADNGGDGAADPFYITHGTSFHTNVLLVGQGQKGWLPQLELLQAINQRLLNINVNKIKTPARLILIGDFGWANCWEPLVPRLGDWHGKRCFHNLAFMDGHVNFQCVRKGIYNSDEYSIIPFKDLFNLARKVQEEEECL